MDNLEAKDSAPFFLIVTTAGQIMKNNIVWNKTLFPFRGVSKMCLFDT